MKLYDIAHSRAGDKGNISTLSLIPFDEKDYELLLTVVTIEKVKKHLNNIVLGDIVRYEMPNVSAFLFVCQNALMGGVTTSLAMDTHGKTLSYALLDMEIWPLSIFNKKRFEAKQSAELPVFERGGHGFGMRKQNLPSDTWMMGKGLTVGWIIKHKLKKNSMNKHKYD